LEAHAQGIGGKGTPEFLSDHPSDAHRVQRIAGCPRPGLCRLRGTYVCKVAGFVAAVFSVPYHAGEREAGSCRRALRRTVPGFHEIDEQRVVLVGVRDLEPYLVLRFATAGGAGRAPPA
jgi:hypothetical protein